MPFLMHRTRSVRIPQARTYDQVSLPNKRGVPAQVMWGLSHRASEIEKIKNKGKERAQNEDFGCG